MYKKLNSPMETSTVNAESGFLDHHYLYLYCYIAPAALCFLLYFHLYSLQFKA